MNDDIKLILNKIGLPFEELSELENQLVPRDIFLDKTVYKELYNEIPILKNYLRSSSFTCVHSNAEQRQRWPLLNITRQILRNLGFRMEPIRRAEGYSSDGKKLYTRYFFIQKIQNNEESPDNNLDTNNDQDETETTDYCV